MTSTSKGCEHPNILAHVEVARLTDEADMIIAYSADVKMRCADCGVDFVFLCPVAGVIPNAPARSLDGLEIHLPIHPVGRPDLVSQTGYVIEFDQIKADA